MSERTHIPNVHGACGGTWTALGAMHCGSCHQLFSSIRLFDQHRSTKGGEHGSCLNPYQVFHNGERVMFLRDGMWRGPVMTDEEKLRRFGTREETG
jgi:hypothetical protein